MRILININIKMNEGQVYYFIWSRVLKQIQM